MPLNRPLPPRIVPPARQPLPAPGLDWLVELAEHFTEQERAVTLELLDLASFALASSACHTFAEVSMYDVSVAMTRIAGA